MTRRPSGRRWQLRVRDNTLALVAPHGVFRVRGMEPEVERIVARMPDDAELECEGDYEGVGNIESLIVTSIVRESSSLVPLTEGMPDDYVHASAALSRARAAERLGVGDVEGAATALAYALNGSTPGIASVYAALPQDVRARMLDRYAAWVARETAPGWEELRWVPFDRWSRPHLEMALATALKRSGWFGAHSVEALVGEVARRGESTTALERKVGKLRRAQATEGGVTIQIFLPPMVAGVVGATRDTIYVAGWLAIGPAPIVPPGARRQLVDAASPVVIAYDTDGVERERYSGFIAHRVVGDVALQARLSTRTPALPALRRLDGTVIAQFTDNTYYDDGELVAARAGGVDEVRTFSGELVASWRAKSTSRIWWDDTTIYVEGDDEPQTYPRPPRRAEPWVFEVLPGRRIRLGPSASELVEIELAFTAATALIPPWLVVQREGRIVLIALAELMTSDRIRVQGKQILKRV